MAQQEVLFEVPITGKKQSKAKPANVNINRINRKIAKRRYYLHKCLTSEFVLDAVAREIKAPYNAFDEIPIGPRYYIGQLLRLGYKIQYKLL
jgi:hypothetical protein